MRFAYLLEPPFNFVTDQGVVTGCDIELARLLLRQIGVVEIEFVKTDFAALLAGLEQGKWAMTTGLFITPDRLAKALFTRPIWALPDGLLLARGNPLRIKSYRCLAGNPALKLAVVKDQVQHRTALANGVQPAQIKFYDDYLSAAQAVGRAEVDAFASVARAHLGFSQGSRPKIFAIATITEQEKPPAVGAFALAKDQRALVAALDRALGLFLGSQEHRALMTRYGFADHEIDQLMMQEG